MDSDPEIEFLSIKKVEPRRNFVQSPVCPTRQNETQTRPRVAHVRPTPQIEQGLLSPSLTPRVQYGRLASPAVPTTPRSPLAELDPTQVSQRLLRSPSSTPASPSLLLTTQIPASTDMERRVSHLQKQVDNLTIATGNQGFVQQQRIDQLEQEKEELEQQLQEEEQLRETLKVNLASLNNEYMTELTKVRQESQDLKNTLQDREESFDKLQIEHKKGLKTIQGLRSYISTLTPEEEVSELKVKLEEQTGALEEAREKMKETESNVEEMSRTLKSLKRSKLEIEIENKEISERVKELSSIVKAQEKVKLDTRNLDENSVELLALDKNELESENGKLREILQWKERKFEKESSNLQEQVKKLGGLLEQTNTNLQETYSQLRKKNIACSQLETENKTKTETISTLSRKLEIVGAENSSRVENKENSARLERDYGRLARCMGKCLSELDSLMDLANTVMDGGNPNLSVLLGVNGDISLLVPRDSPLSRENVNLPLEDKLVLVRQQIKEVERFQEEITELRKKIGEAYSDRLAGNASCLVQ